MHAVRSQAQAFPSGDRVHREANEPCTVMASSMQVERFDTHSIPKSEQLAAWRSWNTSVIDVESEKRAEDGFAAANTTWSLDGFAVSRVSSPALSVDRAKAQIRRDPIDHWAIVLGKHSETKLTYRGAARTIPARIPFVVSLADEYHSERMEDERTVLFLARDSFQKIVPILDAARGTPLTMPQGHLIADYILLLERSLRKLPPHSAPPLKNAIAAMLGACLSPSDNRAASIESLGRFGLKERVRQCVRRHLRSPSLGPDKLCRDAAMSRSQLYRLLVNEGGAAQYIKRLRLSESFAILCDTSNKLPVSRIAESLCFADASNFCRAFRREFGMTPSDVRAAAFVGLEPVHASRKSGEPRVQSFVDCLRAL